MEGAGHAAPSGAECRHKKIERAAHELLQYFDAKSAGVRALSLNAAHPPEPRSNSSV